MQYLLVSIVAKSSGLVVLLAVDVGRVVERAIAPANWATALLILKRFGQLDNVNGCIQSTKMLEMRQLSQQHINIAAFVITRDPTVF